MFPLLVAPIACQPQALPEAEAPCEAPDLREDEVLVDVLRCAAQQVTSGEGRTNTDIVLATASWTAVIRHPQDALTVAGVGGGTVIDLAIGGGQDFVHEIVPVVGGGWLDRADLFLLDDGVRIEGVVVSLPELGQASAEGERRSVTWRADGPWLVAEGAEGFRLNPRGDETVLGDGGLLQSRAAIWGWDGEVDDLGGVSYVWGTDRLLVANQPNATAALVDLHGGQRIAGRLRDADTLVLTRNGRDLIRLPTTDEVFDLEVPADVDGVRAEAVGRAPGPTEPPATDLLLATGDAASVTFRPVWDDGLPHLLRADIDGNRYLVGPAGTRLRVGAGVHQVRLSAGPVFETRELRLELFAGQNPDLVVRLAPRFDPGKFVMVGFDRPGDRSVGWRGSDLAAALEASAEGLAGAVFGVDRDVVQPASGPGAPRLVTWGSARVAGPDWFVAGLPWGANGSALHGGVRAVDLGPLDAAAAVDGSSTDRDLRVDPGWLAAVRPEDGFPLPTFVALDHPGRVDHGPWYDWLDAARMLVPTGPITWMPVDDPALVGRADLEQPLYQGRVSAGNGPLLWFTVDGAMPGGIAPPIGDDGVRRVAVTALGDALDHLVLRTDKRDLPVVPGVTDLDFSGRWVVLEGWSDDPDGPWAVSGPIWLRVP